MVEIGAGGFTEEEIEDIVGAMAEAGYGLAYDDAGGLIKKTRQGPNPYDAAQTFVEPDVTVSNTQTEVSNGSLRLLTNKATTTASRALDYQSQAANAGDDYGLKINPNTDLSGVRVSVSAATSGATNARLWDGTTKLDEKTGDYSTGGETITLDGSLSAGTTYSVTLGNDSSSWTAGHLEGAGFPKASGDVDITSGRLPDGSNSSTAFSIRDVTALVSASTGSATVEWPNPTDIYEWDTTTFTRTLDNETVDVFVAYSGDGGSTWTRANGGNPISRNYSLADDPAISPDDEVRIKAELQRDDLSNNPTLDSAYRSWVL